MIIKMEVILILMSFSLLLALGFLVAFLWAVKHEQYEDTFTPSIRILIEDESSVKIDDKILKE